MASAGTLDRARGALASRDFRFLLAGRLASQFGDGLFQAVVIAVIVFLDPDRQGTAAGVARATILLAIPFTVVGPFVGFLADRWPRRAILSIAPLVRAAAALGVLARPEEGVWLYAFVLAVFSVNRFYLATASASIPAVVARPNLLVANSMSTVGGSAVFLAGTVTGTQLAEVAGLRALLAVTAVLWTTSAGLMRRISIPLRPRGVRAGPLADLRRDLRELVTGFRRIAATPPAAGSIASVSFDQLLFGIMTSLSLVVFREEFQQGVASYGRIIAAGGVGVLVGIATVGALESRVAKPRIMAGSFVLAGVTALLVSAAVTGPTILLLAFVIGVAFAYRKIPADTIVQEEMPDRYRGRAFVAYDISYNVSRVTGVLLAVPLVAALSTPALVVLVGIANLGWAPLVPAWLRRAPRAAVRFYAGGRAEEVPRAVVMGGEEEPVEVERSSVEEVDGERRRRFRVRTEAGETLDLWSAEGSEAWFARRVP